MIPLLHDFTEETVLVFGGGAVGARKARRFAREAEVIVVSPSFDGEFGDSELVRDAPDAEAIREWVDRTNPALVVAATDDAAINEAAEQAAREVGALVNRTDRSDATGADRPVDDVVVPATIRDDPVVVSVSTGGASPAVSRYLRQEIESDIEGAGAMAKLTGELRGELRERSPSPGERRDAVRTVVNSSDVWKALRTRTSKGRQVAEDVIQEELGETHGGEQ
ncbi:precorrin-2 dehydrogenase/sirohydrochlorin ferrochelatase family protein [Natranaeroarchaeum aerophilus]|uniref:precorrin-2 dehydrogenase n=1 Tax=Natranaeroarchaeum aerophilus TaxID=2917711 RepID=A0AAE3K6G1_9EURY|nr:bifunctional precorrin-2 dehydrogenase/sirohydrochlorin ferrochelatase [Natranaeroarchaeum aerophilus]MCL9812774.1 bifunctional precorrin-2 dehydrogenase/sirohydrochlorin ferrochelatase [Natranaeroarchaeum aerophilus]